MATKLKSVGYMVVWNDEMNVFCYGADPDCEGGLIICDNAPLLFTDKPSARRAIKISTQRELLNKAQGKPVNDDFTTSIKFVRVIPVFAAPEKI